MRTDNAFQRRVHSNYQQRRQRVHDLLIDAPEPGCGKIALKLRNCCKSPRILESEPFGLPVIAEQPCRSRLCPRCAAKRRTSLMMRLLHAAKEIDDPRFITLTLRSTNTPLADQLKRLRKAFTALRRRKIWLDNITAGIYTIEVTYNSRTEQWHPHIHCITDGRFIPQAELAAAWLKCTGDSNIVDVRRIHSRSQAITYIVGYVAKSSDVANFPDHAIPEWASAIADLRLAATLGTLHGHKVAEDADREDITGWSLIADSTITVELMEMAARGASEVNKLVALLLRSSPRPPSNADPGHAQQALTDGRDLASRLRTLICNLTGAPNHDRTRKAAARRDADRRQLRLGQEHTGQSVDATPPESHLPP